MLFLKVINVSCLQRWNIFNKRKGRTLDLNKWFKGYQYLLHKLKQGKISQNLLNEVRQITYSLYRLKEINKKGYNNVINSIKL